MDKIVIDLTQMMDEIFEGGKKLGTSLHEGAMKGMKKAEEFFKNGENIDYYPAYSFPPMNIFMTEDKQMVFEFALAGYKKEDLSISFKGDYMLFSAKAPDRSIEKDTRFFKKRLKFKSIEEQRYYVPSSRFQQQSTKANFTDGILRITIDPDKKNEPEESWDIDIEG